MTRHAILLNPALSVRGERYEVIAAQAPAQCPVCGGEFERIGEEWATTTDIVVQPQARVAALR